MAFKTTVDRKKCNGCEECLEVCTADVLKMHQGKAVVANADDCIGCESCVEICREIAITVEDTRVTLSPQCQSLLKDIL